MEDFAHHHCRQPPIPARSHLPAHEYSEVACCLSLYNVYIFKLYFHQVTKHQSVEVTLVSPHLLFTNKEM